MQRVPVAEFCEGDVSRGTPQLDCPSVTGITETDSGETMVGDAEPERDGDKVRVVDTETEMEAELHGEEDAKADGHPPTQRVSLRAPRACSATSLMRRCG